MANLTDVLNKIRQSPGIMLGRKSAHTLHAFLTGFLYAKKDQDGHEDVALLAGFNDWVRKRYEVKSSQGWAKIVAFHSADETEELDLFWKLFDKYMQKQPVNGRSPR